MPSFAVRHPYLIVVFCLFVVVLGLTSLARMPVDMFPPIKIPVVLVATFYSGMPPQQIEADITDTFERFFTLASGVDHMESRSLPGVSLIKIYFQPGTDADADVTSISNLAMADLRRLPQGTLPPVVLKVDASSLPVCLLTVEGEGLNETQLHDYLQYQIRNQIAGVPGATVPPPYGGKYRQIMVYVDPLKLQAHQLSPMDVVRATNSSNLILPAGDVRLGPIDYNIYTNAQVPDAKALNDVPLKTEGEKSVFISDVGKAVDGSAMQYNIVRVNGQKSVYVAVQKQGGDTNTIAVVDGIRNAIKDLRDIPAQLHTFVTFDQSVFVKEAISTVLREGGVGIFLTGLMILVFLGSFRATVAVFLSIPISVFITFFILHSAGKSIDAMVLSGLALAFSRLIDDSVVVIENIYRHLEMGEEPAVAAVKGANEVALAVLAIMLVAVVVFFPVTFLFGVSAYLFGALALGVVLALFASYFDAVTVVPLFCANYLKAIHEHAHAEEGEKKSWGARFHAGFNAKFEVMLNFYEKWVRKALERPGQVVVGFLIFFVLCFLLYPLIGVSFFPRTDAGQFVINVKAPTGTRIELTEDYVKRVENIVRQVVPPKELETIVSNIGLTPGSFFAVHAQRRNAYRVCPGGLEGRPQGQQLRLHGRSARARRVANSRPADLLSIRRLGGRGAQPRRSRTDRCSGERRGPRRGRPHRAGPGAPIPRDPWNFRRLRSPGYGLSRATGECESRSGQRTGTQPSGSHRQPHHVPDVGRDDCPWLLGRSQERQQLLRDRAVSGKSGAFDPGFEGHAPAWRQLETSHVPQSGRGRERGPVPHRSGPLSTATIRGHLRGAHRRRYRQARRGHLENYRQHETAGESSRQHARTDHHDAEFLPKFRDRPDPRDSAGVPDSGRAVRIVYRSLPDCAGRADWARRVS